MTRGEALASYEKLLYAYMVEDDDVIELDYGEFMELNHYIRSALRPVSRERVEKVWRGGWVPYLDGEHIMPERYYRCSKCGDRGYMRKRNFCPYCGAPMTDEAVEMVMERLEALKDGSTTD